MAYTSHGHHMPGTVDNHEEPKTRHRCGGPRLCRVCAQEAAMYTHPSNTTLHGKREHMLDIKEYVRKSFNVEAVQVTEENMAEVAKWCGGRVRFDKKADAKYIQVHVPRAVNTRQRQAFTKDWVLKGSVGFKVYTEAAFENCFAPENEWDLNEIAMPEPDVEWKDRHDRPIPLTTPAGEKSTEPTMHGVIEKQDKY